MFTNEACRLGNLVFTRGRDYSLPQAKYAPVLFDVRSLYLLSEYVYLAEETLKGSNRVMKVKNAFSKTQ